MMTEDCDATNSTMMMAASPLHLPHSPSPASPANVSCTMPAASMELSIGSVLITSTEILVFMIIGERSEPLSRVFNDQPRDI